MAVQARQEGVLGGTIIPVARRRVGIPGAQVLVGVLVLGAVVGSLAYALRASEPDTLGVQGIQRARAAATVQAYERAWANAGSAGVLTLPQIEQARAEATVEAYERSWASTHQGPAEVRVTGTGPGLVTIAEQQASEG